MVDDYETIDYKKHYEATKEYDQRLKELEQKARVVDNLLRANNLI